MRQLLKQIFSIGVLGFGMTLFGQTAEACPDYHQWGSRVGVSGPQLRHGLSLGVVAGGDQRVDYCLPGGHGEGWAMARPDFTIDLDRMRGRDIVLEVRSECDATLIANSPSGRWYFDDDSNGNYDPALVISAPGDGYLDVWIGTYDGSYCDATLFVRSEGGRDPQPRPQPWQHGPRYYTN